MSEAWPAVLKPTSGGFRLENTSRSGGIALNGQEQVVVSLAGRWRARFTFPIRNKAQVLAARALDVALDGRAGTVLVPTFDWRRANWPVDAYGRRLTPKAIRSRRLDGTIFEDPEIPTPTAIVARVNGDAVAGATSLAIDVEQGAPLRAGQDFGIAERLYRIVRITAAAGTVQTVNIRPRLRHPVSVNTPILITGSVCKMRQATDDQGISDLALLRFTDLTLEFVEVL